MTDRDTLIAVQSQLTLIQGEIAAQLGTSPPVVVPPVPPIPPTPPTPPVTGNDSGFWQAQRWSPGVLSEGQTVSNTFKVPDGWPGTPPHPIPGGWGNVIFGFSYPAGEVQTWLDDGPKGYGWVDWPGSPQGLLPGFHTLYMKATKQTVGSVNVNHTP